MQPILPAIQAVIFDLDGVVLDSERCYFDCWRRAAADLGYPLDEQQYADLIGIPSPDAEKLLAAMMGEAFPEAAFVAGWNAHWEELLRREAVPLKPGVLEFLDRLDARSLPWAIASSSYEIDALRCLGSPRERFPVIVCRDQVAHGKPAPDLFLAAAAQLCVIPQNCLAIEDSAAGIRAAAAAGIPVILVPDMKAPSAEMLAAAWRVCPSLFEVARWLFP